MSDGIENALDERRSSDRSNGKGTIDLTLEAIFAQLRQIIAQISELKEDVAYLKAKNETKDGMSSMWKIVGGTVVLVAILILAGAEKALDILKTLTSVVGGGG